MKFKCFKCGYIAANIDEIINNKSHCPKCQQEFTVSDFEKNKQDFEQNKQDFEKNKQDIEKKKQEKIKQKEQFAIIRAIISLIFGGLSFIFPPFAFIAFIFGILNFKSKNPITFLFSLIGVIIGFFVASAFILIVFFGIGR